MIDEKLAATSPAVASDASRDPPAQPKQLSSEFLFGNAREILIQHKGEVYRLRKTSRGKLILTK